MQRSWKFIRHAVLPCLITLLAGAGLILAVHEEGTVLRREILANLLIWVPSVLLLIWVARLNSTRPPRTAYRLYPVVALTVCLILSLFTKWYMHRWFFFLHWNNTVLKDMASLQTISMVFILLTGLLTPLVLLSVAWTRRTLQWTLIGTCGASLWAIYAQTGWNMLIRDDHPSFVFRIWKIFETFPRLRSYNPFWNAGELHSYAPESGVHGPTLFFYPFLKFFPLEAIYTPGIALLFIVVVPILAVLSARAMGIGRIGQCAAGILALFITHFYYLWLMPYGTSGANLAQAFVMPVAALLYRIFFLNRYTWKTGILFVVCAMFLVTWPPGMSIAAVFALSSLCWARYWSWPKWRFILICSAIVAVLHARYYIVLLGADIFDHVHVHVHAAHEDEGSRGAFIELLRGGGNWIRAHFRQANPMLLYFGIAGSLVLPWKRARLFFIPLLIGFAALTAFGPEISRTFQLERMIHALLFASVLPAALCIDYLLRTRSHALALLRAAVVALLILSGWNTYRIWNNEGRQRYVATYPDYNEMVDFIRETVPEQSRLLFVGSTVHAYGGGHVTYLPVLTGREMMSCDFYHFDPRHVEYEYPPRPWRDNDADLEAFIQIYNVSMVSTFHNAWINRLRAAPDLFEEVATFGNGTLHFFAVKDHTPNPFVQGRGRIRAHFNRFDITLETPDTAVIPYHWVDGLTAGTEAELFPYDIGHDVQLIGIRPQGEHTHIVIRHSSWL